MARKIASHYTLINGSLERNIVVEVDDNGIITNIIRTSTLDTMAGVEFYPGILIPGMINAHCHLELSYLHRQIEEGTGFAGFARAIGSVRNNFSNAERIYAAKSVDAKMWAEGVDAVADIANDELIMDVKHQSKIEYYTLFEHFGLNNISIAPMQEIASRHHNSYVTPHSTYSVQDAPFKEICGLNNPIISVHLLESDDESQLYQHHGSLWQWYERMGWRCDFLEYGSPAKRIVESVPRNKSILLVHATRATKSDVAMIENHTPYATWVVCPESNRYISNLKPDIAMLRDAGVKIAIGTDSLASARTLSMVENLRQLSDICNVTLEELLTWATYNGAMALGIESHKGSIEIGKRPGLVVIEGADLHNMQLLPESTTRRII